MAILLQVIRYFSLQELAEARNFTISHFKHISDYIPTTKTLSQIDKIIEETYSTTRSKD